jgi:hypothetical protein
MWETGKPPLAYFWLLGLGMATLALALIALAAGQPPAIVSLASGAGLGLLVRTGGMWAAVDRAGRRED